MNDITLELEKDERRRKEKFELLSIQIIKIYLELKVEEYATKINRFKERSHGVEKKGMMVQSSSRKLLNGRNLHNCRRNLVILLFRVTLHS